MSKVQVNTVLNKLKQDAFPGNRGLGSWGIGFCIDANTPLTMFKVNPLLLETATKAQQAVPSGNIYYPQVILNCEGGRWLVKLEYYDAEDDGRHVDELPCKVDLTGKQRVFLQEVFDCRLEVWDLRGNNVFDYSL